jgi:phage/plasmid-like protein (TIGR03299 family)
MAHQVESMFYVGETPWHKLGTVLPEAPTIREAIVAAGLDWTVSTRALYLNQGDKMVAVDDAKAIVRDSDNSCLGVVGSRYVPLQNDVSFDFFQPFVDSKLVQLETAGSLQNGKKIWVLARIVDKGSDIQIAGDDVVRKFIMLSNSHDGSTAIRVGFTPVRIVCANTLKAAHNSDVSRLLRIRHTRNAQSALMDIQNAVDLINQEFSATAELYRSMASKQINKNDLKAYVKVVLGHTMADDQLSTRAKNQIDRVISLFEYGRGNNLPGVKGTVWAAYNAVTEYLTHEATSDADKRYSSLWFGQNSARNELALNEAMKLAA